MQVLGGIAECGVLLAIGHQLRSSGLFRQSDGQTVLRLASYLTLPSVIARSILCHGPVTTEACLGAGVALVVFATQGAATWLHCLGKQQRERAVLMGCSLGTSMSMVGLPVAEAVFGGLHCLQPLVLASLVNDVAVRGASYLFFGSAGPAFPEAFKHQDGGVYRGQWRGMRKEGLGSYTYASGAKYEGEWRDNLKDGRGVYYYPKGGTYEGEWAGGVMNGVGVRTLSTGEVKAGRWRNGVLESPLELWQCTYAAEGSAEAALAARSVEVGGGTPKDAMAGLLQYVPLWVAAAALIMALVGQPLPPAVDAVTAALAPANKPLMLLAAGMALKVEMPQPLMVPDVSRLLATRLVVPLAVCATLLILARPGDVGIPATVAVMMMGLLSPLHLEVVPYAHSFRLSESLASAMLSCSWPVAGVMMLLCALAIGFTGLTSPSHVMAAPGLITPAAISVAGAATAAAATNSAAMISAACDAVQPLMIFCTVAMLLVVVGMGWLGRLYGDGSVDQRVMMVYAGPVGAQQSSGVEQGTAGSAGVDVDGLDGAAAGKVTGSRGGKAGTIGRDLGQEGRSDQGPGGAGRGKTPPGRVQALPVQYAERLQGHGIHNHRCGQQGGRVLRLHGKAGMGVCGHRSTGRELTVAMRGARRAVGVGIMAYTSQSLTACRL